MVPQTPASRGGSIPSRTRSSTQRVENPKVRRDLARRHPWLRARTTRVTDASTATAYSISQQFVTTAWSIVFAIGLVVWVFGWTGGKKLVTDSYTGAKEKVAEERAARRHRVDADTAAEEPAA